MILYSFFMSSCAWRVRAVLQAKGIRYEYRAVNLLNGEQLGDEFLRVNAMGQVPVLVDGELAITESIAAIEYLEEKYPRPALLPTRPELRAQVRQICQLIASGTQPVQAGAFSRLDELGGAGAGLKFGQEAIARGFAALERRLQTTAGACCVGDSLTLADCCLVPQVFNAQARFKVDVGRFPVISRLQRSLLARSEFAESHPAKMADCPHDFARVNLVEAVAMPAR